MNPRSFLPILIVFLVVISSGCINTSVLSGNRPEDIVKSVPQVQEFFEKYPETDISATYRPEDYIRAKIEEISDRCGPYFKIADYWEIAFFDYDTKESLTVWIEKSTNQLGCLYGDGVDSPPPYIPGPGKTEIMIAGFSGIGVSESNSEFSSGKLFLTISNPMQEEIVVKRVSATYLDISVNNLTNTGLLKQGEQFTYSFDLSEYLDDSDPFWIDVEILYDRSLDTNIKSKGSVISGVDTSRIIQCSKASFDVTRQNFYIGTRILDIRLINTGEIDLLVKTYFRNETDDLEKVNDPFTLEYQDSENIEIRGLNKLIDSVIFVSESCPNANVVLRVEDIPGV